MTANAVNKTLEIVESEYRPNQSGTGMVLQCLAQEVRGPDAGRLCYLLFDLENDDEEKQNRGQRDFAALRRATGVLAPEDSAELHFKPFRVKIGVQEDTGANVIKQYLFADDALAA